MASSSNAKQQDPSTGLPTTDVRALMEQPVPSADWIGQLEAGVERAVVDSDEKLEKASDLDRMLGQAEKKLEEERTAITAPLNQVLKHVNAKFKPFSGRVSAARKALKAKMTAYYEEQERKRREAEEAARRAAEEEALAEAAKLEEAGDAEGAYEALAEAAETPVAPVAPAPSGPVRGDYGGTSSFTKTWKFEITDPEQVPREFCSPDEKLIREAVKNGTRSIAGVNIYETTEVRTR